MLQKNQMPQAGYRDNHSAAGRVLVTNETLITRHLLPDLLNKKLPIIVAQLLDQLPRDREKRAQIPQGHLLPAFFF